MAQGLRHLLRALLLASLFALVCAIPAGARTVAEAAVSEPDDAPKSLLARPLKDDDKDRSGRGGGGDDDDDSDDESVDDDTSDDDDDDDDDDDEVPATPTESGDVTEDEGEDVAVPVPAPGAPAAPTVVESPEVVAEVASLDANPKVDPAVARVAEALAASNPEQPLRLLVFGDASPGTGDVRRALTGDVASVSVTVADLAELAASGGVDYLALDVPVRPTSEGDAALPGASFSLLDAAPYAWARGRDGRGVGVAVVDSGVGSADAFGSRLVRAPLGPAGDSHGHGTFVAGILAGRSGSFRGIASGARVYDVNVSQPDGVYTSDVIAGLEWVLANHERLNIRVVNLSLAETIPSSYRRNPLDGVVERLWRSGVVVVVAAGNLGPGKAVFAPANDPYVITVGALDQGTTLARSDDAQAAFSATGPTLDGFVKPDVLAPGRRIVSLLPADTTLGRQAPAQNVLPGGLAFMSGTSFAAPQVAAAAAVLLQQHPTWTPDEVKWVLTRTARPVAGSSAGTLDLRAATSFRGRPAASNRALRPATLLGGFGADGADLAGDTWSSNTWSSNAWSSNTWSSNTWSSNTWSSNTWSASGDAFTR